MADPGSAEELILIGRAFVELRRQPAFRVMLERITPQLEIEPPTACEVTVDKGPDGRPYTMFSRGLAEHSTRRIKLYRAMLARGDLSEIALVLGTQADAF